jgi:hypothetical protein
VDADHWHTGYYSRFYPHAFFHFSLLKSKRNICSLQPAAEAGHQRPLSIRPQSNAHGNFYPVICLGILYNSLALILIFTPLFIFINYWELKRVEEPELEKRLGQEYIDYKKRVPMFFPLREK